MRRAVHLADLCIWCRELPMVLDALVTPLLSSDTVNLDSRSWAAVAVLVRDDVSDEQWRAVISLVRDVKGISKYDLRLGLRFYEYRKGWKTV